MVTLVSASIPFLIIFRAAFALLELILVGLLTSFLWEVSRESVLKRFRSPRSAAIVAGLVIAVFFVWRILDPILAEQAGPANNTSATKSDPTTSPQLTPTPSDFISPNPEPNPIIKPSLPSGEPTSTKADGPVKSEPTKGDPPKVEPPKPDPADQAKAQEHFARGRAFQQENNVASAVLEYTEAIQLRDDFREAYYWRGMAFITLNQPDKAMDDFNYAIQLSPDWSDAYVGRSMVYAQFNDWNKTINDLTKAITLGPATAELYWRRGGYWTSVPDLDKALDDYNTALAMDPQMDVALSARSSVFFRKGNYDRALQDLSTAISIRPQEQTYFLSRAKVYVKLNQWDSAISDCSFLIDRNRYDIVPQAYAVRGTAWDGKGETGKAIDDYSQVLLRTPDIEIYFARAEAYARLNDRDRAVADFKVVLDKDWNDTRLARARQYVYGN